MQTTGAGCPIRAGGFSRAAQALGLERSHLYRKMKTLGIHLGE